MDIYKSQPKFTKPPVSLEGQLLWREVLSGSFLLPASASVSMVHHFINQLSLFSSLAYY